MRKAKETWEVEYLLFIDNADKHSSIEQSIKAQILDKFSEEQVGEYYEEMYGT